MDKASVSVTNSPSASGPILAPIRSSGASALELKREERGGYRNLAVAVSSCQERRASERFHHYGGEIECHVATSSLKIQHRSSRKLENQRNAKKLKARQRTRDESSHHMDEEFRQGAKGNENLFTWLYFRFISNKDEIRSDYFDLTMIFLSSSSESSKGMILGGRFSGTSTKLGSRLRYRDASAKNVVAYQHMLYVTKYDIY